MFRTQTSAVSSTHPPASSLGPAEAGQGAGHTHGPTYDNWPTD